MPRTSVSLLRDLEEEFFPGMALTWVRGAEGRHCLRWQDRHGVDEEVALIAGILRRTAGPGLKVAVEGPRSCLMKARVRASERK